MIRRVIIFGSIISLLVVPFFLNYKAQAAPHTTVSDVLTRLQTTENANHTITFDLASAWNATETLVIDFVEGDGFDTTGFLNSEAEDYDITWEGAEKTIVANGGCAADSIEITTVNTTTDTFTFTLCAGSTASAANDTIVIEIGTNATAGGSPGDDQINNATGAGSKTVSLTGPTAGDSAQFALAIMSSDQVEVSATVDPTISAALETSTCALATLSTSAINFCEYDMVVNTNATGGYVSTIADINATSAGKLCSPSPATCTNDIDVAGGDNDVDQGSEEYGVSSNDTVGTQTIIDSTGCDDSGIVEAASAISTTAQVYADSGDGDAGPVSNATTTVCHSASITATTTAGSYNHIATHITTGTF